jgi:membrane-associated protein
MDYKTFLTYNVIGGILWGACVPILGYFLGSAIPGIDRYILPIVGIIVLVSLIPIALEWLKYRNHSQ